MTLPVKLGNGKFGGYGWRKQPPDWRDLDYLRLQPAGIALPNHFDLHSKMPPIWNQGKLGSCTAHGSLRAYVMDRMKLGLPIFMPSRLLQYYDSRYLMGTVPIDSGATCRDAIRAIANWGACDEALWPYDIAKFAKKPPATAYTAAASHKAIVYRPIPQDLYQIKAAIFAGYGVVFGFTVYSNFENQATATTGLMSMPAGVSLGGHCVCAIGWHSKNYIMCANSWVRWGAPDFPGCFWMPPDYITNANLASAFWVIQTVQ